MVVDWGGDDEGFDGGLEISEKINCRLIFGIEWIASCGYLLVLMISLSLSRYIF
jgi:hypothetical protein